MKSIFPQRHLSWRKVLPALAGLAAFFPGESPVAQRASAQDQTIVFPTANSTAGVDGEIKSAVVQADGKIILSGSFTHFNAQPAADIIRLNADGLLDPSFRFDGLESDLSGSTLQLQADGKLLVFGADSETFIGIEKNIIRLNADGGLDPGFVAAPSLDYNGIGLAAAQDDGKLLVDAGFTRYGGASSGNYRLTRLLTAGGEDPAFHPAYFANPALGFPFGAQLSALAVQPDGKILAAGNFSTVNGEEQAALARFNADGSLDQSFRPTFGLASDSLGDIVAISAVFRRADGGILVSGSFTSVNGSPQAGIALLDTAGALSGNCTLDDSLTEASVRVEAVQNDGKILVTREDLGADGAGLIRLLRLQASGAVDSSFAAVTVKMQASATRSSSVDIRKTQILANGKIVVAGNFSAVNGAARNSAVRLNADGSIDDGFNPGVGKTAGVGVTATINGFKIFRTGGGDLPALLIRYKVKGDAAPGVDYTALSGMVGLKAGQPRKTIHLQPLGDAASGKTVKLILVGGQGYKIGSNRKAERRLAIED